MSGVRVAWPALVSAVGLGLAAAGGIWLAMSSRTNAAPPDELVPREASAAPLVQTEPQASAERGRQWITELECSRCHSSNAWRPPPPNRSCVSCHQQILAGTFEAPEDALARWQKDIRHLVSVPPLTGTQARFRNDWLVSFLREPHDLRPNLEESMLRLAITEEQARDIAALLAPHVSAKILPGRGDLERGRQLFSRFGCGSCHAFESDAQPAPSDDAPTAVFRAAPHLRHVRARLRLETLVPWLLDPRAFVPETRMPNLGLTEEQATDIATYLVEVPLADPSARAPSDAAPPSPDARPEKISFEDVNRRVFRKTCWHCHSDPDFARGDGGPGNTGGFGFAGVGLNLASYEGVSSGALEGGWTRARLLTAGGVDADPRERESVIEPGPSGTRLVRALRARQSEEQGRPLPGVRGMPLGLPALSENEIRLIEAWVAQGAPN